MRLVHPLYLTSLVVLFVGCGTIESPKEEFVKINDSSLFDSNTSTESIRVVEESNDSVDLSPLEQIVEDNSTKEIEMPVTVEPIPQDPPPPTPPPTPPVVDEPEEVVVQAEESEDYISSFINESNCDQILDKEFLTICYDHTLKVAKSVTYTLSGDLVNELNIQERPSFYVEQDIDREYRASTSDYTNSGYDRGHLAPDASFDWSQESLDATYSLANIIPQVPTVNRRMWIKAENYAREKAVDLSELEVINIVKYTTTPDRIGDNNISVSIGYYKILFNSEEEYKECFYYANDTNASSDGDTLDNHRVDCLGI